MKWSFLALIGLMMLPLIGCDPADSDASRQPPQVVVDLEHLCPDVNMVRSAAGDCICRRGFASVDGVCAPIEEDARQHDDAGSTWTILVYMVADNNLEPFGLQDIEEMVRVGNSASLNIVIQADRAAAYADGGVADLGDWTTVKRLHVDNGGLTELDDLGELNMGNPATLADFISWGTTAWPADRTAIILWDHGASWPGFGGDESTASLDMLDLRELAMAFEAGLSAGGLDEFDIIGFDACLMGSWETASTLAPYGEFFIASEDLEPGHGWDFTSLRTLLTDPSRLPEDLGRDIVDGFASQGAQAGTGHTLTLSLVDLYRVTAVTSALEELSEQMVGNLAIGLPAIATARMNTLTFGNNADPTAAFHMMDLSQFGQNLSTSTPALSGAASALVDALSAAIRHHIAGSAVARARGMSIYFPLQPALYKNAYGGLPVHPAWSAFLTAFLSHAGSGDNTVPTFTNAGHVADAYWDDEYGYVVSGSIAPSQVSLVTSAYMNYAIQYAGEGVYLILGSAIAVVDTSGLILSVWDGETLVLSQGDQSTLGYWETAEEGTTMVSRIPFLYEAAATGARHEAILTYVSDETGLLSATWYVITPQGVSELFPWPGDLLIPLLRVYNPADGTIQWLPSGDVVFAADQPVDISFENLLPALPSGTVIELDLFAENAAGNGDVVSAEDVIP